MPKRTDINSILIIGSGPIVIGQACEFDYSGTQACVALKEEGYRIILVNSNPATIMTDPDLADATYIEPITVDVITKIIEIEKPNALLPTMGGQTALNCAMQLAELGILEKYRVELIGASIDAIQKSEDRQKFKTLLTKIGLDTPKSYVSCSLDESREILEKVGLPAIIRPSYTLGGFGGGVVCNEQDYFDLCALGLSLSPHHEIQIDESIYGWKEFELEVMRDKNDNVIIVCSIENVDPVGIHTGDSITVAPAQTLRDKEYQQMRDAAIAIIREVGVDSGGCNVQFAVNPQDGTMLVIEMNPRVSRSSALASKATGYPIARIAAKLAIGYTLNELDNDITQGKIPASFEPSLDYVVTKIPRFDLEKFPGVSRTLGSQMKSVGEVMAIGRSFQESLQKALVSLEITPPKIECISNASIATPTPLRLFIIMEAMRRDYSVEKIHELSQIDPWFLQQIFEIIQLEQKIQKFCLNDFTQAEFQYVKQQGFSDAQLAFLLNCEESQVRTVRQAHHCLPAYNKIDTCAAEFFTPTEYNYSTYNATADAIEKNSDSIIIIGSGPNRIGLGIEFDYCCVHAVQAVRAAGYSAVMINCNPETVSTDYNISDKLYFEPITFEKVMDIIEREKPKGVILQFGGQTPLKLCKLLQENGVPLLGTNHDVIHKTENRESFKCLIEKLGLLQPKNTVVYDARDAQRAAQLLQYPLIIRPSFVLGGRSMKVVLNSAELEETLIHLPEISVHHPLLLEEFIDDAVEIDVDAVCDGREVMICGVMEHVERAGVHSGDSACSFPTVSLSAEIEAKIKLQMQAIALECGAIGLVNAQFAIKGEQIYIIEVNPRASRTIPFISKATGIPWVQVAVNCMLGKSLREQNIKNQNKLSFYAVKESVFPFAKLPGSNPLLSPEMKSTGEVMGFGRTFHEAFYKAQCAATSFHKSQFLPSKFILISEFEISDQSKLKEILHTLQKLDVKIMADPKYKALFESYQFNCQHYFTDSKINYKSIAFMIHLGKSESMIFQHGVRLGVSYATSVQALLSMLATLTTEDGFELVTSIQAYATSAA